MARNSLWGDGWNALLNHPTWAEETAALPPSTSATRGLRWRRILILAAIVAAIVSLALTVVSATADAHPANHTTKNYGGSGECGYCIWYMEHQWFYQPADWWTGGGWTQCAITQGNGGYHHYNVILYWQDASGEWQVSQDHPWGWDSQAVACGVGVTDTGGSRHYIDGTWWKYLY